MVETQEPARSRIRIGSMHVFALLLVSAIVFRDQLVSFVASVPEIQTGATIFLGVFVQATPFLVLGVLVSGVIAAHLSPRVLRRLLPSDEKKAVGVSGLAGMALPGCECGAVPVSRRLMDQGAPTSAALAFLLSAPAINPVVLVSTAVAFPGEPRMVLARFVGSLATAWVMGWLWARAGKAEWITARLVDHEADTGRSKWEVFSEAARHDLLQAGAFLVFGAGAAAVLHIVVPDAVLDHLAGQMLLAILVMAFLAVVLALCSEADAFVAASMSMLPLLPRLVFLVVGPAVDVKLMAMQSGSFGRGFVARFAPVTLVVAIVCATVSGYLILGGAR
ncbi:permease [Rhodococcus sp. B10]|uniref:permease n=1 Tax=Rhodococcus sp. B10 TaxID=2695876 RepID=UPI00142FAFC1|nr:permease [Rhodococcus sp. B10]NIL75120.1 putative two-component membrane permease complex subunit [Rhodococcus sp. B10]